MLSHPAKRTFATQFTYQLVTCRCVASKVITSGRRGCCQRCWAYWWQVYSATHPLSHPIAKPEQRSLLCRPHLSSPERSQQPGTSDCTACVGCLRGETTEWHSRYALTLFAHTLSPPRVSIAATCTLTQRTDTQRTDTAH